MKILHEISAWLAHLFGESGAEQVNLLFDLPQNQVSISVLSILEVYGRLKAMDRQAHWLEVWEVYIALFTKIIPADEAIAHQAILLRTVTPERLPTIDGLIAATAVVHQLILVHRDLHMVTIPAHALRQLQLPDK